MRCDGEDDRARGERGTPADAPSATSAAAPAAAPAVPAAAPTAPELSHIDIVAEGFVRQTRPAILYGH